MKTAAEVGQGICDLCREGKNLEAVNKYYADDVVSVEAAAFGDMPRTMKGIEAVRGKHHWWEENNEVHSADVQGPFPHGDEKFAALHSYETTFKPTGQRNTMTEVAVYTVKDGKVTREEFFYAMPSE